MKKLKKQSLEDLAKDWGIDYQTFRIKMELVDAIKSYCKRREISQRRLASMVPGLTQDRVSKIFSGQVGTMTLDKILQIMTALDIKVRLLAKAA